MSSLLKDWFKSIGFLTGYAFFGSTIYLLLIVAIYLESNSKLEICNFGTFI